MHRSKVRDDRFEPGNDGVALRPNLEPQPTATLRAILAAIDHGVLLTDLDHKSLACNRVFGEIFGVEPTAVVSDDVEGVRSRVLPIIRDADAWLRNLDEVYANPLDQFEDDLVLDKGTGEAVVRRFTGPVVDSEGRLIGRVWTFQDVTRERRAMRMREALQELSDFYSPEPRDVLRKGIEMASRFFDGAISILSVRKGDWLEFSEVAGAPPGVPFPPGNEVSDSYCQYAIESVRPFLVQDARQSPALASLLPARFGQNRYLGAPVMSAQGSPVGTICVLDHRTEIIFDDADVQFLSMLALRVGSELAREENIRQRIEQQEREVARQRRALGTTRTVLSAMNEAFDLFGSDSRKALVKSQVRILHGLLDYEACGLFVAEGGKDWEGFAYAAGADRPRSAKVAPERCQVLSRIASAQDRQRDFVVATPEACVLAKMLGTSYIVLAPISLGTGVSGVVAFGNPTAPPVDDEHHRAHLEALVEQVNLLLRTQSLKRELVETGDELETTSRQLVESEKLSVAGTLAASTAHDIRNILSTLSILLNERHADPEWALSAVRDQLDRFSLLSHRLLSYAKPRMVSHSMLDVAEVLEYVVELTGALARIHGTKLEREVEGRGLWVMGERHQLEHLIVNLVINAIQAMADSGGSVKLRANHVGANVVVEVIDTGKGIVPEDLSTLFQPFLSGRTDGTGLGLYSCRRIAQEHGGTLEVESKIGVGTTFRVTLAASRSI
ncbi:MAG: GAF domain-containing protein [Fimbriimonadaceae bacterium]|nr:GAF domain-containing protein [Fimbriimonadaceae bacterium]QYK56032.1 MAG: GAF domain-containing protein [Fimbriimonadaceae bacterium]